MNDFSVTVNSITKNVILNSDNSVKVDDKVYKDVELSKINSHLYLLRVNDRVYEVTALKENTEKFIFVINGLQYENIVRTQIEETAYKLMMNRETDSHKNTLSAPMPGLILSIKKNVGDEVTLGESIIVLEAMKMENDISASSSGVISKIFVEEGKSVEKGQTLITIE